MGIVASTVILVYAVAMAFFTGWLASEKGRQIGTWAFLGLVFGIIALLAVGLAPQAPRVNRSGVR